MAEDDIRRGWLAAAGSWASRAVGRVMAPWRQARMSPDAGAVLTMGDDWQQALTADVVPPITAQLRGAYQTITGQAPPDGFDQRAYVTQYLAQAVNRMSGTPEQVYRFITEQLTKGIAEGDDPERLALRVQAVFTITGNPFWENRAATVARTETVAALNAGQLAGAAHQEDTTGRLMIKTWRAHPDERTREAHRAADGQEQLITAPFTVGGEHLMYPGDPRGSAAAVINCRCALDIRPA